MPAAPLERLARTAIAAADARRRPRPRVRVTGSPSPAPTVYFLVPDVDEPSGGIRVMYRHVDLLNGAGIRAAVLHQRRGFRCTWFENGTRVTDVRTSAVAPDDLLVVPELDVDRILGLPPGHRHVVFNQNPHLTWRRAPEAVSAHYRGPGDLCGVITVSEHSAALLRYAFPGVDVRRVRLSIDPAVFALPGARTGDGSSPPPRERPRRISYMPRRGRAEASQVLQLLRGRGVLDGWTVDPLDGISHEEVGRRLQDTMIFLSFAYHEGFGLPGAEAMACGSYVVGFHGFGGREFFLPDHCTPVPAGDVLAMAQAVEAAIRTEEARPGWCAQRGRAAAAWVAQEYSPAHEAADVEAAYRCLLEAATSL